MNQIEDVRRRLKEACKSGSVAELLALIEADELILDRVNSLTCSLNDTPLHVVALRGHLEFTKALLTWKPKLATELDSLRCSPLHLASTEGHVEIVQELLLVNTDLCTARDQDGRIPLHLAVMKGRVNVISKLLEAKGDSIHEKLHRGETVMHFSVKYNQLEALKTLVHYLQSNNKESLLNSSDDDGNTILHLAVALKQLDTIEYLLGVKCVKDHVNVQNQNDSTALDFLLQDGVRRSICGGLDSEHKSLPDNPPHPPSQRRRCKAGVILQCLYQFWLKYFKVDHTWLEQVRGHLITAATLTATMAYQAILSPPGGFWQDSGDGPHTATQLGGFWQESGEGPHIAGLAILDSRSYYSYQYRLLSNASGSNTNNSGSNTNSSAAFNYDSYNPSGYDFYTDSPLANYLLLNTGMLMASLCTIMLALSGFPTDNKLLIWLLILTVYATISCMAYGYLLAMSIVSPFVFSQYMFWLVDIFSYCWIGLCGFVLGLHACHFLVWLCNKFANLKWLRNKFRNLDWPRNKFGNLERLWKLEWLRKKFRGPRGTFSDPTAIGA